MNKTSVEYTIFAPAKVNIHLAVKEKRPDGFHNLESIFLAVDFGDTLHFILKKGGGSGSNTAKITMSGRGFDTENSPFPQEKNIVFKALSLFRVKTGFSHDIEIKVEKRIPLGGGLGGGSSDAAATLLALNELAGFPLDFEALLDLAAALGSDVPFFIHRVPAAKVTGRGECIQPIDLPLKHFVLVNPGFESDTKAAYKLLDEYRDLNGFSTGSKTNFFNDFLDVFNDPEKSVYNKIISQLIELGAEFASLSGAGSTCFGVFPESESAQTAVSVLRKVYGFVEYCRTNQEP